jgi:hypothetical protein
MLLIRNPQMQALERERLAVRIARHLREFLPAEVSALDAAELDQLSRRVIDEAFRYELRTLPDLLLFASLVAAYGSGWAEAPGLRDFHEIMTAPHEPPSRRLQRVCRRALYRAERI